LIHRKCFCNIKLSQLFNEEKGFRDLFIWHFMFGEKEENPCSLCTNWIEGYIPHLPHLAYHRQVNFVAIARAPIDKLTSWTKKKRLAGESVK